MPEMRRYVVKQVREVHVIANNAKNAIAIAKAAYDNGQNSNNGAIDKPADAWGNTETQIRETSLIAEEKR